MEPGDKRHSALRPSLIADVGATNARFAVVSPEGGLQRPRVLACEDYSTIHGAIAVYLVEELPLTDVRRLETAAPVKKRVPARKPSEGEKALAREAIPNIIYSNILEFLCLVLL